MPQFDNQTQPVLMSGSASSAYVITVEGLQSQFQNSKNESDNININVGYSSQVVHITLIFF